MYGGNVINEGNSNQFKDEDFRNSYQNEGATGKKQFVVLWLHAYKYTYKDLTVTTDVPKWAAKDYKQVKIEK